jgi:murein DD-endopeptidase MepM/ murein hydrolase activator NlpD
MGYRMWLVPGETAFVPAQGREPTALPDPVRSIDVRPLPAVQGRTEIMQIALDSPALAEGSLGPWMLHFEPVHDKDLVALQGVYAMADPGLYDLVLKVTSPQGQVLFQYSQPVFVASGGYPFDPILEVAPDTIDPNVTGPENDQYAAIVAPITPDKLWDGVFRFPTDYTKSFPSRFGSRRNYNGTGYNSYHSGLDLYGDTGKPIYAAARGRVVFTGETTIRGNLTILDHGWGVYTAYLHQSEIKVSVGEVVDAGQLIGLVGATGRVTGPHLHWEVLVGGIPVNPIEWTQTAFP